MTTRATTKATRKSAKKATKKSAKKSAKRRGRRPGDRRGAQGFTLLEVMIAMAILSVSMVGLYTAQMANMNATAYARDITAIAFLGEFVIVDIENQLEKDGGWVQQDKTYAGDFSEQGWPDVQYSCLIDFVEMPEYSQLREVKDASEQDTDGRTGQQYQDAGDQMFSALATVWPLVKNAIEQSIRKVTCDILWKNGERQEVMTIETYWTEPANLTKLPNLGGEFSDEDDQDGGGGGAGSVGGAGGGGGNSRPSSGPTGSRPSGGIGLESRTK